MHTFQFYNKIDQEHVFIAETQLEITGIPRNKLYEMPE